MQLMLMSKGKRRI